MQNLFEIDVVNSRQFLFPKTEVKTTMKIRHSILFLSLIAFSTANASSLYEINFSGATPLPTSGSFVYNPVTSTFSNFTVTWDGLTFDLTTPANTPTISVAAPTCVGTGSGGSQTFAMLSGACDGVSNEATTWIAQDSSGISSFEIDTQLTISNPNGFVNDTLYIAADSSGQGSGGNPVGSFTITAVPEPSAAGLLMIGLALIAVRSWKAVKYNRSVIYLALAAVAVSASCKGSVTFDLNTTAAAGGWLSSGVYAPISIYSATGGYGVVLAVSPTSLPVGGGNSSFFTQTLTSQFSVADGWQFNAANSNQAAANTLAINAYQTDGNFSCPFGPLSQCVGIESDSSAGTLGWGLSTGNPLTDGHWIQVYSTLSYPSGSPTNSVDNNGDTDNPYYDSVFAGNATTLLDSPALGTPLINWDFFANTYYVSGPETAGTAQNPAQVTVYNGVSWGWVSLFVPTTDYGAFVTAVDSDLSSVASFNSAFPNDQAAPVSQADVAGLRGEFNSAAVPEPSMQLPVAALLALFACTVWKKSNIR
jgi:hypothetical protein